MMDQMIKLIILLVLFGFADLINAQDQSGFISIDCGIPDNSNYTDEKTGINYVSDLYYTDAGVSKSVSASYKINGLDQQLTNVRSFPEGLKNCYTLTPPKLKKRARYFVRASFMYGNYDNKNQAPKFDVYLGVNYWDTVEFTGQITTVSKEILHVPSSDYTYVCLINTGNGTPFISVLELRLVNDAIYTTRTASSLALFGRWNMRSYENREIIRYGDDIFDRVWQPSFARSHITELNTSLTIGPAYQNNYTLPSAVMSTAITMENPDDPLDFNWKPDDSTTKYFIYIHFADFQSTQIREFNITLNGAHWFGPFNPNYLSTVTIYSIVPETPATWFNFSFIKTFNSDLPPMMNAIEIYFQKDLSNPQTNQQDVDAIKSIKSTYGLEKNWQGDPCTPDAYSWLGLTCSNDGSGIPRIVSLNLSSSGLTGTISPSVVNLNLIQSLDLSNNSLTGEVPKFLSQMPNLSVLDLSGNNFTGTVPSELIHKSTSGSLKLSIEGNPLLCSTSSCKTTTVSDVTTKKSSMLLPIIASVAAIVVLLIVLAIVWICIIKRRKSEPIQVSSIATEGASGANIMRDGPILTQRQHYTYAEVIKMTKNFQKVLGKGGFGSVFYGSIDKTQVAVKMLSPSSAQGYKQFKAEAELLMRVHHRNLTTLVGYCDEDDKLGLIYEFMANGDLETHLSDKNLKCLSWELRLEIALDAAQGLEYLHTGCKPPIIHRDIKTTNILLNEEMQAKLADFGLSKAFPAEGGTHVSTAFAGTPGYFDPEYNLNEKSDVYSFGVVLLEILTGKPPIAGTQERTHISRWVAQTLEAKGDVRDVVDPRLGNDFDSNSAWKLVDVAMECASPESIQRPTMNQAVIELKNCLGMEKARIRSETENETNYESAGYTDANIGVTAMSPLAR